MFSRFYNWLRSLAKEDTAMLILFLLTTGFLVALIMELN